jgi:hypothetical protein
MVFPLSFHLSVFGEGYHVLCYSLFFNLIARLCAVILNLSAKFDALNGQFEFSDKLFDHYARALSLFITKSAGNENSYVTSPGNGWNLTTVGGTNIHRTSNWSDDTMFYIDPPRGSNWRNVTGNYAEKREVVAPAQELQTTSLGGTIVQYSGTSYAAPQVAGVAALLTRCASFSSTLTN